MIELMERTAEFEVSTDFKWRDRRGQFHYPKDMETRHLFFTVRMIWNHTVPDMYQIKPFERYNFSSFYTSFYMGQAVRNILSELSTRNDLTDYYIKCLLHMCNCMRNQKLLEV